MSRLRVLPGASVPGKQDSLEYGAEVVMQYPRLAEQDGGFILRSPVGGAGSKQWTDVFRQAVDVIGSAVPG